MKISSFKQTLTFLFLLSATFEVFSQVRLSGIVVTEKDEPIQFVSIGIIDTNVGTISETDGTFHVEVPKALIKRELIFSALGFERQSILVKDIAADSILRVVLKEKVTTLKEVTVQDKSKFRRFEFGNRLYDGGSMYAHTHSAGSAMVILVDNRNPHYSRFKFPAVLDHVSMRIVNNTFKEFKLRLRVYSLDSLTGKPDKDLLDKDILVQSKIRNGWLELDLSPHAIAVDGPFFIGFEWILDSKDRAFLHKQYATWQKRHPQMVTQESVKISSSSVQYSNYNGTFWAGTSFGTSSSTDKALTYFRYNSFGEWFLSPVVLCARIEVLM